MHNNYNNYEQIQLLFCLCLDIFATKPLECLNDRQNNRYTDGKKEWNVYRKPKQRNKKNILIIISTKLNLFIIICAEILKFDDFGFY